jgi:hypothetical protein
LNLDGDVFERSAIAEAPAFDTLRLNRYVISWRVLALLLLSVLVGEVGVNLDHFQALMAQMALERKELTTFQEKAYGVPMAAGMRTHSLIGDAAPLLQSRKELGDSLLGEWATVIGQ